MEANGENTGDQESAVLEMESIKRISKLPVVESTINLATDIYGKVKDSNVVVGIVLTSAETKLKQAAEMAQPVTHKLEGPLKKMDSVLCSSLDYAENNAPFIRLPPQQMYENTKSKVYSTVEPAIKCVCAMTEYGVQKMSGMTKGPSNLNITPCQAGDKCCLHGKSTGPKDN